MRRIIGAAAGDVKRAAAIAMDLSIVIPAYNEEKRILIALEQTLALLQQRPWSYELLVVDDGSTDRTVACIAEYAREHPQVRCVQNDRNRGKGYSVQHGVAEAQGPLHRLYGRRLQDRYRRARSGDAPIGSRVGWGDRRPDAERDRIRRRASSLPTVGDRGIWLALAQADGLGRVRRYSVWI